MTENAALRRGGATADHLDARRIDRGFERHRPALFIVDHRTQRHVAFDRLTRSGVHVAHRGADLRVGIRGQVLHEEVHEPSVALEEGEKLRGAMPRIRRRWWWRRRRWGHPLGRPHHGGLHIVWQLAAAENREPRAEGQGETLSERDHPLIVSRGDLFLSSRGRCSLWELPPLWSRLSRR